MLDFCTPSKESFSYTTNLRELILAQKSEQRKLPEEPLSHGERGSRLGQPRQSLTLIISGSRRLP